MASVGRMREGREKEAGRKKVSLHFNNKGENKKLFSHSLPTENVFVRSEIERERTYSRETLLNFLKTPFALGERERDRLRVCVREYSSYSGAW